ncbi:MAG: hypothetical protein NVSMB1_26860 [Polyangiales bacterium]
MRPWLQRFPCDVADERYVVSTLRTFEAVLLMGALAPRYDDGCGSVVYWLDPIGGNDHDMRCLALVVKRQLDIVVGQHRAHEAPVAFRRAKASGE